MTLRQAQDGAVDAVLLPGFRGTTLPDWVAERLRGGLVGVCLYGENVESPEQVAQLVAQIRAVKPDAIVAIDEEGGDVTRLHYLEGSPYPGAALLGRIDDVIGNAEGPADDVGVSARQEGDRDVGPGQPVGDLVHGPVATERDDDVVAPVDRVATDLGRMVLALGGLDLDLIATLERVDDEVLETVRDSGRIRVHDDQHAALAVGLRYGGLDVHEATSKVENFSPSFSITRPSATRMSRWPITSDSVRYAWVNAMSPQIAFATPCGDS